MRLWLSDTVSQFGNTFSQFAIPVLARLFFQANALELGLLPTLGFLPYPTLGLFVGVWADRFRRRRIMVACNFGRMIALTSIPVAYLLGDLTLIQLFAVSLINGILSVFFDVSYQSYLPVLVERQDLVEGNQKLQISASAAQVAGPGIAGAFYQFIGGAFTIGVDVLGYPVLRTIGGCTATSNFGSNIWGSVFVIFALEYLHNSTVDFGLVGTIGAVGFVIGVLLSGKITSILGVGMSLAFAISSGFVALLNPLAQYGYSFEILAGVSLISGMMGPVYNINAVSLRQAITPLRLQGRMNATTRTIVWGTIPLGSFLGGVLGITIGIVSTMYLGALIAGLAVFWILLGPVRKVRTIPESAVE